MVVREPQAVPVVDIGGWFRRSWEVVKPVWLECALAILLFQITLILSALACYVPLLFVVGPMQGGLYVYMAKRIFGLPTQVSDIYQGFRRFMETFVLSIAIWLIPLIVIAILLLPSLLPAIGSGLFPKSAHTFSALSGVLGCSGCFVIILFVLLYPLIAGSLFVFAYPLVMFRGMKPIEALKTSFRITARRFFNFFFLLLASFLTLAIAQAIGFLLVCIGFLVTVPVALAVITGVHVLAYCDFVGLREDEVKQYA